MTQRIALAFLLLVAVGLSMASMAGKSATVDEVPHLAAGYSYLVTDDYRMNFEHPPLIKKLAAAPLLFLSPRLDLAQEWNDRNEWVFGQQFLYKWNEPDRLIFWARVPIVALFALLGLLVYCCARDFYGPAAGLTALVLYVFTPDLLAHGQLITTDLGITLFSFAAVYFFYKTLTSGRRFASAAMALSVGLAAVTKYSVAVLALTLVSLGLYYVLAGVPERPVASSVSRLQRLRSVALLALVTLATVWLLIWLTYGFRHAILPPQAGETMVLNWAGLEPNLYNRLLQSLNDWKVLPEGYLFGATALLKMISGRVPYFMGAINPDSWQLFYPVSFALKTPLPLLVLLLWTGVNTVRRRGGDHRTVFLLVPAALFFVCAVASKIGIGNRHILPIYPFLIVWVAQLAKELSPLQRNLKSGLLVALLAWQVVGTLSVYPNFLTYYNELAGGPRRGYFYMVDSNFDWGQDLPGLAEYRRTHAEEAFYVSYFGMADPTYYLHDVHYLNSYPAVALEKYTELTDIPPNALVAISATKLMSRDLETTPRATQLVARMRVMPPLDRIGNSILIYRMP